MQTKRREVIPLKTQARYFKKVSNSLRHKLGSLEAKNLLSRAVYLFGIGSNDYLSQFLTRSNLLASYSHSEYVGLVIGNLTTVIKEVYKRGGRKIGFINLPPLGYLPGIRILESTGNGSCLQELSSFANLHNQALSLRLSKLEKQLKGFKYSLYDFNTDFAQRLNHPLKYGFKGGNAACCGSGPLRGQFSCGGKRGAKEFELCEKASDYLFWDSYHLTESAYKQFATQMWNHIHTSNSSYSMRDLFQAL
ncbi:hypothetical protein L6164_004154 [Bauhinia variegata]|uniref:Uncharacterized protein n=1 Tax=Bauhinia variegata TaxID=167791 RepID=A0ACB9Q3G8_BAUVA|nr:hypothetical protein L6164_004154 [Bauhinia variegata]